MLPFLYLFKEVCQDAIVYLVQKNGLNRKSNHTHEEHLMATMEWLLRSHQACNDTGCSRSYSLYWGWQKPFPETTGYIIPTFLDYYEKYGAKDYLKRAIQMADWEVSIQMENGAFMEMDKINKPEPIIFDTGQVILGLLAVYSKTGNKKYLDAAEKSGIFLISTQNGNGTWVRWSLYGIPHTYHARVSFALVKLFEVSNNNIFREAAIRNLSWVLSNQKENGWFNNCNFKPGTNPNSHSIAYTTRGLFESGLILQDNRYIEAALKTAKAVLKKFEIEGKLKASYDEKWRSRTYYVCFTGNIQFAIIWSKIYLLSDEHKFLNAALKMLDYVISEHNITCWNKGIRGGVKGSVPIFGRYAPLKYPNWAAKFLADALMLRQEIMGKANKNLNYD